MTIPFLISATFLLIAQVKKVDLDPRPWIALFALFFFFGIMSGRAEKIARPVAWIIAFGMIYSHGDTVIRALTETTQRRGKAA